MGVRTTASRWVRFAVVAATAAGLAGCTAATAPAPEDEPAGSDGGRGGRAGAGGRGGAAGAGAGGAMASGGQSAGGAAAGGTPGAGGDVSVDGPEPLDARAPDAVAPPPGPSTMSEACGKGLPAQMEGVHDIMVGAMPRKFFLRVPSTYDGKKPWPVIFGFHGAGNKSAGWFDTNTDLRPKTEEKAVLLFPEGALRGPGDLSWVFMSPDNVLFVDAMLAWLKQNVCIDLTQIFAAGQSSGGYMAMTLGCQRGDVFRGVATSSGGILDPGACTGSPAAIWMRTGKADTAATHKSVLDTRDFWVKE